MFAKNVGTVDRALRVLIGLGLIYMAYSGQWGAWAYVGVVPLLTGIFGTCGLYSLIGINTCGVKR